MTSTAATSREATPETPRAPLTLSMPSSGEEFVLLSSARRADGLFRFRWTLAPGKKGPPPHVHPHETETFHVRSGRLSVWLDGVRHDCGPGDLVAARPGVLHRFLNPGDEPVVVEVTLDGTLQEDNLAGIAYHARATGREPRLFELLRQTVVQFHTGAIGAPGVAGSALRGIAALFVALGVRGFAPPPDWDA